MAPVDPERLAAAHRRRLAAVTGPLWSHLAALVEVVSAIPTEGPTTGEVPCRVPDCRGSVRWARAPNGHRRGACSACDFRFIE